MWLLVLDALFLLTFISFGPRACGIPLKIKRCDSEHVTKLVFAFVFLIFAILKCRCLVCFVIVLVFFDLL